MKEKMSQEIEKDLEKQSEQKLFNDVTEFLIKETKFDLPEKFLKKWMSTTSKENLHIDLIASSIIILGIPALCAILVIC